MSLPNATVDSPSTGQSAPVKPPASESRFFALDAVRATAMLLGVLYHALLFGGGMMGGFGGGPSTAVMNWIHSFRMPLFFLISGFFCHLMFQKYGLWRYLFRRWWRIGIPFLLILFALAGINSLQGNNGGFPGEGGPPRRSGPGERNGPGPNFGPGMNRGPGPGGAPQGSSPTNAVGAFPGGGPAPGPGGFPFGGDGDKPPPPAGFVPPFLQKFDKDKDGSLSAEEWKEAQVELRKQFANGPGGFPGGDDDNGPGGPPPGFGPDGGGRPTGEPGRFGPGRPGGFGPGGGPPGGRGGFGPFGRSNPMADTLFGKYAGNFRLQHLWFLWYLMVFATAAPFVALGIGKGIGGGLGRRLHHLSSKMFLYGVAPVVLAALSIVGMQLSGTSPGQPPGGMATIFGTFPDVLFRYDPDWPYFFTYFLAGWWLYRNRIHLNDIAKYWLIALPVGLGAHVVCSQFSGGNPFAPGPRLDVTTQLWRYFLFGISVAGTSFGMLGFFQRYLDRPTKITRYLADTAFWIYLVHQDLLNKLVLGWVRPWALPGLLQGIVATLITCAIALISFELLIRWTPLTILFGPPRKKRPAPVHSVV